MLDRRTLGPGLQRRLNSRRMQRKLLADPAGVDGNAGVLADEVLLVVGDLDVAQDRRQHALPRDRRLASGRVGKRVAQVLRDVLQRPDVQVRRGVLDDAFEIGRDHARAPSAAARPARRPKTQHSNNEFPIIRFLPCVPPAISPHAYIPSIVVVAFVSMTSPPFW